MIQAEGTTRTKKKEVEAVRNDMIGYDLVECMALDRFERQQRMSKADPK